MPAVGEAARYGVLRRLSLAWRPWPSTALAARYQDLLSPLAHAGVDHPAIASSDVRCAVHRRGPTYADKQAEPCAVENSIILAFPAAKYRQPVAELRSSTRRGRTRTNSPLAAATTPQTMSVSVPRPNRPPPSSDFAFRRARIRRRASAGVFHHLHKTGAGGLASSRACVSRDPHGGIRTGLAQQGADYSASLAAAMIWRGRDFAGGQRYDNRVGVVSVATNDRFACWRWSRRSTSIGWASPWTVTRPASSRSSAVLLLDDANSPGHFLSPPLRKPRPACAVSTTTVWLAHALLHRWIFSLARPASSASPPPWYRSGRFMTRCAAADTRYVDRGPRGVNGVMSPYPVVDGDTVAYYTGPGRQLVAPCTSPVAGAVRYKQRSARPRTSRAVA